MPRIPVYEQQLTPSQGFDGGRASPVRSGLSDVAAGLSDVANVMVARKKQQEEDDARTWFATSAPQADLAMMEHMEARKSEAPPGADGFTPTYLKEFDSYAAEATKNAPNEYAKRMMTAHLAQTRASYGMQALRFEAGERTRYRSQTITEGVDSAAKLVMADPSQAERWLGAMNGIIQTTQLDAETRAKLTDYARTNIAWYSVIGEIDRNPQWQPAGAAWELLDAKAQLQAKNYADGKVAKIRQEAQVSLRYETQDAEAQARAGVAPTAPARSRSEFLAAYDDPQVADREWQRYSVARGTAQTVSTMHGRTSAELTQIVATRPSGNAAQIEGASIQASAADQILRARAADPVAYAQATGDFGFSELDPSAPAFGDELKRRAAAFPTMAQKYGTAGILSKQEGEKMAAQLSILPADQKVEKLETMREAIADDDVYRAFLNTIRPDSPVTALVGNIAAAGSPDNARMIARGEDLLNPTKGANGANGKGAFPMPTETQLRSSWVEAVGNAYRDHPEAEATAYQAFKAYYAAAAAQKGLNDPSAGVDDATSSAAVTAATGGVAEWSTAWFSGTPDVNVVLPYGMPEATFRDRVMTEWNALRDGQGYSKTDYDQIGLFNTGADGEYVVMSGTSWLPGKDGRPIILRIR